MGDEAFGARAILLSSASAAFKLKNEELIINIPNSSFV
jgi:hypothetical protein